MHPNENGRLITHAIRCFITIFVCQRVACRVHDLCSRGFIHLGLIYLYYHYNHTPTNPKSSFKVHSTSPFSSRIYFARMYDRNIWYSVKHWSNVQNCFNMLNVLFLCMDYNWQYYMYVQTLICYMPQWLWCQFVLCIFSEIAVW